MQREVDGRVLTVGKPMTLKGVWREQSNHQIEVIGLGRKSIDDCRSSRCHSFERIFLANELTDLRIGVIVLGRKPRKNRCSVEETQVRLTKLSFVFQILDAWVWLYTLIAMASKCWCGRKSATCVWRMSYFLWSVPYSFQNKKFWSLDSMMVKSFQYLLFL